MLDPLSAKYPLPTNAVDYAKIISCVIYIIYYQFKQNLTLLPDQNWPYGESETNTVKT